jgi:hypothetical protein
LRRDLRNLYVVNIHLLLLDQIQQQVQRSLIHRYIYFVRRRHLNSFAYPLPITNQAAQPKSPIAYELLLARVPKRQARNAENSNWTVMLSPNPL